MNRLNKLITIVVLMLGVSTSSFADLRGGYDAYAKKNYRTAYDEFKPLAEQGDSDAQHALGGLYRYGRGVLKDYKQAVKWFRKAAEQGDASAQYQLGAMYITGQGVLKDLSKAKYWIKKAYENPNTHPATTKAAEEVWNESELWKY
jgi:uncharacterized protein